MRKMKHESVAKKLAKNAIRLYESNESEKSMIINGCTWYMRLDFQKQCLTFGSGEKEGEITINSSAEEYETFFLQILKKFNDQNYLIEYSEND